MYNLCCNGHAELSATPKDYQSYIDELIAKIWEAKQTPVIDEVLLTTYGNQLSKAALNGYGVNIKDIDWSSADSRTIASMLKNTWQFSGAKTYTQLRDIGKALVNPDGSYKNQGDFIAAAQHIAKTQLNWLKTERNTAIGGGQMIALWEKIEDQKELFPLLQFDAVIDLGTTALCESLNGVIKPVDDEFWEYYYPLNHFGCRSTVRQLRKGEVTPDNDLIIPENIPAMFRTNLAKTGLVFPEGHAYYKDMPQDVYQANRQFFPYNLQFDVVHEDVGMVKQHFMVDKGASDYERLIEIAVNKAKDGNNIDLMPAINPNKASETQRNILFFDAKLNKSPDLRINGILVEEEFSTKSYKPNNIMHAIAAGYKQADYVIITLSEKVDEQLMFRWANSKFKQHQNLKVVEYEFEGVFTKFERGIKS